MKMQFKCLHVASSFSRKSIQVHSSLGAIFTKKSTFPVRQNKLKITSLMVKFQQSFLRQNLRMYKVPVSKFTSLFSLTYYLSPFGFFPKVSQYANLNLLTLSYLLLYYYLIFCFYKIYLRNLYLAKARELFSAWPPISLLEDKLLFISQVNIYWGKAHLLMIDHIISGIFVLLGNLNYQEKIEAQSIVQKFYQTFQYQTFQHNFLRNTLLHSIKFIQKLSQNLKKLFLTFYKFIDQMQKTSNQIIQELEYHNKSLKDNLLPSTEKTLLQLQSFYAAQKKDYGNILKNTEEVLESFRSKLDECEGIVNQIIAKKQKDSQFTSKGQGFLHAKGQQIRSKVKNIDAVSSGIKETVAKVKVQKLIKLPVKSERALGEVFRTLYQILYEGQRNKFDWETFRDLSLKHEDGEDFIFRLVNINFKDLKQDYFNDLLKLKSDPEFDRICLNAKFSQDILDLADWIEYVCVGHQFAKELKDCNKEYDKIRKDIQKRSKGSLQMSQKFWRDTSEQIQGFQNGIEQVRGEIKAIQIGMNRSVQNIQESLRKRNNKIIEINAM